MRNILAMVALLLMAPAFARAQSPNGEAVYTQHCASCHEGALPRMPTREALRAYTPEAVETALSSFTMRRQGAALNGAERRAVAEYLTGRPAGSYRAPLDVIPKSAYCTPAGTAASADPLAGPAWNGWGPDQRGTRFQPAAAAGLAASDVPRLKLKWAFGFPGVSASGSQVSVVGSRAFVGSRNGLVYALDTQTGCLTWAFEADAGVRSTPVVDRAVDGRSATRLFRRRTRTGLRARRGDRRDAMEGQSGRSPGRDRHGRSRDSERPAVRRRLLARGGHGRRAHLSVLHVPRQRRLARCGNGTSDRGRHSPFPTSRVPPQRIASARSCSALPASASGRRLFSILIEIACMSARATATRILPRGKATRSWRSPWTPAASCGPSRHLLAMPGTSGVSKRRRLAA